MNNFADNLWEFSKIRVKPGLKSTKQTPEGEQPQLTEAEYQAELKTIEAKADIAEKGQKEESSNTLYMELQSTVTYGSIDVDIEKILETTTLDDFINGYIKKRASQISEVSDEIKKMEDI